MNSKTAYLLVRVAVGVSMFGHGLVRLPKLGLFSDWMLKSFEKSMLPELLVLPFSYFLPVAELILGIFLVLGLFTRLASIGSAILMIMLIFGSTLIENWGALTPQFIHLAFLVYVLQEITHNRYSIDYRLKKYCFYMNNK
ncbi:DoxX family protein [Maribacter polysaccharolyticus]|uniref:DoxX family protein n=1 Tax=Maribacter polysaccharolyticus TaxID=3020831 RepID=UPI00237F9A21|nr:DoxX family protein [Maribacter polysaccharolyticus]MDE3742035.1 DoxX family protein [Maribacter polysaccharolyticus]